MLLKLNNNKNGKLELKMGLRGVELALQATHLGKSRTFGLLVSMNLWKDNMVKLCLMWLMYFLSQVLSSFYASGEVATNYTSAGFYTPIKVCSSQTAGCI